MNNGIWGVKVLVITFGPAADLEVGVLAPEDLRHENQGYPKFVRAILEAVIAGKLYDDSDPDAYQGKASFVFYLPYSALRINGVAVLDEVAARLEEVKNEVGSENGYAQGYIAALQDTLDRLCGKTWSEFCQRDSITETTSGTYVCLKRNGHEYHGPCCGCGRCNAHGDAFDVALVNVFTGAVEAHAYGPSGQAAIDAARSRASLEGWQVVEGSDPSPLELLGMDEFEMGDLVHDLASLTATAINNAGREAQVRYILGLGGLARHTGDCDR